MSITKPTSRIILLTTTLTLLLIVSATFSQQETKPNTEEASRLDLDSEEPLTIDGTDSTSSDADELEELIAIDEEEQEGGGGESKAGGGGEQEKKEAEVLSKAQRIVLELNNDNAKRVVSGEENEYVMVLGYAPWCARSAELMPHFAEAANRLKELGSPLLMAKLDADRYPKASSALEIKGFPTLLLFVNGSSQAYTGGFTWEDIVIWARKKTGSPIVKISSVAEAEDFLKKYHTFVLGFFEKFEGPKHEEFAKAAISDNELQFVETSEIAVAKLLYPDIKATGNFIGIAKIEPERYTTYEGTFEKDKILQFLDYNKFPLVTKLTELNSVRVYSSSFKLQVMIFSEADEFKTLLEPLQEIARKFKSKMMFIYVDIADENLAKPFLTLFGLEDSENTVVTAFDNRISSKYLLESDPTPRNIEDFCAGLLHGTISPFFKSQSIPDNKEALVQIIVGKTFDDLVLKSPNNVLLEVHTPWCINCETTSKQIEKLAKNFKGSDNLVFAKIDASENEHPKLQVDDYPTLLFYLAGDKENPIKLSTKTSSKDLAAIIKRQLEAKEQGAKDEL